MATKPSRPALVATKPVVIRIRRFARVKDAVEIRQTLKLKAASGYKIHKLLDLQAGR